MAVAANLSVALSLNSARFRQGLDRARAQAGTFQQRVGRNLNNLRNNFNGLQTGIVAVAAALGAQRLLENADNLVKNADAAGFAFETYQRLQFGFEQSGISAEAFARATARVGMVVRDAGRGLSTAQDALSDIGLSYEALEGLSPEQRFIAIVDALDDVEDAATRQALAQQLLGRQFSTVGLNLDAVVEAGEGLVPITEEQARAAEAANDTFSRFGTNLGNLATNVLVPLVAALSPVVERFSDFAQQNPQITALGVGIGALTVAIGLLAPAVIAGTSAIVSIGVAIGSAAIAAVPAIIGALSTAFGAFTAVLIANPIGAIIAGITAAIVAGIAIWRNWDEIVEFVTNQWNAFTERFPVAGMLLTAALDALLLPIRLVREAFGAFFMAFENFSFEGLVQNIRAGAIGILRNLVAQIANVIEQIPVVGEDAAQRFRDNFLAPLEETYVEAVGASIVPDLVEEVRMHMMMLPEIAREAGEGFRDNTVTALEETMEMVDYFTQQLNGIGTRAFNGFSDALTDFVTTGMADFGQFARSIIRDLIRLQIQAAIARALGVPLGSNTGSNIFAGFFQNGGRIPAGQVGIVGEAGPEFVRGPATVTSAADTSAILNGGGSGGVTLNVSAVDARSFEQFVMQPRFAEAINGAVNQSNRSRGIV